MKFSQVNPNASPALVDYLMGVTSANVDFRVTIQNLVTLMLKANLLANPYKFSVYLSSGYALSNAAAKTTHQTKEFDTGNNFDAVTNYRFTAPISGYYWLYAQSTNGSAGMGTNESALSYLYKNGSELKRSQQMNGQGDASRIVRTVVATLVFLNAGDYIEHWAQMIGSRDTTAGQNQTYFQGFLVSVT